jgi:hypothetical protein
MKIKHLSQKWSVLHCVINQEKALSQSPVQKDGIQRKIKTMTVSTAFLALSLTLIPQSTLKAQNNEGW